MSLVWAESGAILSSTAKQAALRGLSGMEWAATVPGTVGGAVYGNAGAYGACISDHFVMAEILQPSGKETWSLEQMGYQYRSSILKREQRRGCHSFRPDETRPPATRKKSRPGLKN